MRFSKLGLFFVSIQIILILILPPLVKLLPIESSGCGIFPCIGSTREGIFWLLNVPGLYLLSLFRDLINLLKTQQQILSGAITLIDNAFIFLSSALTYYIYGWILEFIWRKKIANKSRNIRANYIVICILSPAIIICGIYGIAKIWEFSTQRLEQVERCKNGNGFNQYESGSTRYDFFCKNWQYNGIYKVYDNGVLEKEYTYKNGQVVCKNEFICY